MSILEKEYNELVSSYNELVDRYEELSQIVNLSDSVNKDLKQTIKKRNGEISILRTMKQPRVSKETKGKKQARLEAELKDARYVLNLSAIYMGQYTNPKGVTYFGYDDGESEMEKDGVVFRGHKVIMTDMYGNAKCLYKNLETGEIEACKPNPKHKFYVTNDIKEHLHRHFENIAERKRNAK